MSLWRLALNLTDRENGMPLWLLIAFAAATLALVGLGVKLYFDRKVGPEEVTWVEYGVSMAIIALIVCPLVGWIGVAMAKKDNMTFVEFRNGWEARARMEEISCSRDGPCYWEYDCDPYTVPVPYECGDGKTSKTCYKDETHYHQCPYVDAEYNFYVDTTLGSYTIDTHRFPERPNQHRWRQFTRVPKRVIASAGVGAPRYWSAAKARIEAGDPWPATKTYRYDNYVLASQHTILRKYRGAAEEFLARNQLPAITTDIRRGTYYRSDKVYLVGCSRQSYASWNEHLERLNGALGSELQGDVHLVLVCDPAISRNPDRYRYALEAYWQNTEVFARGALPKNALVILVGTTDQKTVAWGRAFTGMPTGNEDLTVALQSRFMAAKGVAWHPRTVIGAVSGIVQTNGKRFVSTSRRESGVLTDTLWGNPNRATRFERVSMSAKDSWDIGTGYRYLATEVVLTGLQKFLVLFAVVIVSVIAFSVIAFNDFFRFLRHNER